MFFKPKPQTPVVDAPTLKKWMDEGKDMILLDVRSDEEWAQTGIIPGALTVPNFRLIAEMQNGLNLDQGKPIITICRSGARSAQVAEYLQKIGLDVVNLTNGMIGWYQQQYEVERI